MNFFLISLIKIVCFRRLHDDACLFAVDRAKSSWAYPISYRSTASRPARSDAAFGRRVQAADERRSPPPYVNRFFYLLAPFIAVALALISISIIPFGPEVNFLGARTFMQISDVNVGIFFVLAISSVSVYGLALAGWSSNNKYSLIGGLRSSAQMISYELPLTLALFRPCCLPIT